MKRGKYGYLLLLIFITAFCYLNSLGAGFVWDDFNNVVNNEELSRPWGWGKIFLHPWQGFYRPLSYLTIVFDHSIWGKNPFGYHLTNFLFHLFNVILIFSLVRKLTSSAAISFFTALLFAVHPINTEAVTYISGRSDLICFFFLLLSLHLYIKLLATDMFKKKVYLFFSLLSLLLAVLSRENALLFPLLLFSYNLLFLKSELRKKIKLLIPYVIIIVALLFFRFFLIKGNFVPIKWGNTDSIFKALLFYVRLIIFPFGLHMQHSIDEITFFSTLSEYILAIAVVTLIGVFFALVKKKYLHFGLIWFIMTIVPFLGILRFNVDIAEHWLYLPCFGLFLLAGEVVMNKRLQILKCLGIAIIVILSILTVRQNRRWYDDVKLYTYTLKYHPRDATLHYNLGNAYLRRGELTPAKKEYNIALQLKPDYAYALNNLGIVLEKEGELEKAYQLYKKAHMLTSQHTYARDNLNRLSFIALAFAEEEGSFDHSLYGKVLSKYVRRGKVNYKKLKGDASLLNEYLLKIAELKEEQLAAMSPNEQIAFYINAYNALTLKVIVDNYPVTSIRKIPGVWDRLKFTVAGRKLTLNDIEHNILRAQFKDPRIHFVLVCASKGCPDLRSKPFKGKGLDKALDEEAKKFLNDRHRNRLDKDTNTLYLSSIFKWFREDFGDVLTFVSKYLPKRDAEFIQGKKPRIRYFRYDWSLNE
jgi:tetratricopeptide (TPR) repeat protein